MNYSCKPCDKIFNGVNPYIDHINSRKHKMKVVGMSNCQQSTMSAELNQQSVVNAELKQNVLDPYISRYGSDFKCNLCNIILNGIKQAENHIYGKKHKSSLTKIPQNSGDAKPGIYDGICDATDALSFVPSESVNSYSFSFHDIKIQNVLSDIKVFDVNEPIYF